MSKDLEYAVDRLDRELDALAARVEVLEKTLKKMAFEQRLELDAIFRDAHERS